ncbi:MAG TPA: UDP-N-acetylmuramate dehydrogenase [Anaerolineae bacterium]|nr:UDP-N-acetylmuramate dehydrogenase [Anaerolineae bacterium]
MQSKIDEISSEIKGPKLEINVPLSRYTTARIGGPADLLIEVNSADDLKQIVLTARKVSLPIFILGGGANVLVSDAGVRGLTIINKAKRIEFRDGGQVWCESGTVLPTLARECGARGLGGLEWALGVPGTVGGAVVGNAGAHGRDIAASLISATILNERDQVVEWSTAEFEYEYRSSRIKKSQRVAACAGRKNELRTAQQVVLAAIFQLRLEDRSELEKRANEFTDYRRRTQPPGASIGSMFKNPAGTAAGRLIDQAGLKGATIGGAEISGIHANFFVNRGDAKAADVKALIDLARQQVKEKFGVELELEIELVGEW